MDVDSIKSRLFRFNTVFLFSKRLQKELVHMRFLIYLEKCFDQCAKEARTRGKVFPSPYDQ